MSSGAALSLAHQGGWDEALMLLLPVIVLAGLTFLARRKAQSGTVEEEAASKSATPSRPE